MLRNPASRMLSSSRRSWQRLVASNHFYDYHHSSKRANGSLSHLWSNTPHAFGTNNNNNQREDRQSVNGLLPRISLTHTEQQQSLSPLLAGHYRYFSTSDESSPTIRERMQTQRDRGRVAARKGAHSLREMVQKYGKIFVVTYFAIYFGTLGGLYLGIESGVLDPAYVLSWVSKEADAKSTVQVVTSIMDHYSWTRPYVATVESNPQVAHLAVAWIAVKFTEPVRLGTTVAIVPRLSRYLGFSPAEDSDDDDDDDDANADDKKDAESKETSAGEESKKN